MLSGNNLKMYRNIAAFFVSIIVLLSSFTLIQYQILHNDSDNNKRILYNVKNNEWSYVWGRIQALRQEAHETTDNMARNIKSDILSYYRNDTQKLKDDLNNFDKNNNPIINIIASRIMGYYFNDVTSDADDIWVATRSSVISDFSVDCSASGGRTRNFDKEISLHYNKILATNAINNILNMSNDLIGWQFVTPLSKEYTMTQFTEENLKALYIKYGLDSLQSFEINIPSYIDRKTDLTGKLLIDDRGFKQDNNQLIVVQGFNIVNQFKNNQEIMVILQNYSDQEKILTEMFKSQYILEYVGIISTFATTILVFIVGTILLYREKTTLETSCIE